MKIRFIHLFIFAAACSTTKYKTIKFRYTEKPCFLYKAIIKIPQPAKIVKQGDRGEEKAIKLYYKDSSLIFLKEMHGVGTVNYELIRGVYGIALDTLWAQTYFFSGTDKNGKLWMEIKQGNLRYGYNNVSQEEAKDYKDAINLIKIKSKLDKRMYKKSLWYFRENPSRKIPPRHYEREK